MNKYFRRPWVLAVAAVVLLLLALLLLIVTAPSPTNLSVQVFDAETGAPLADAIVRATSRAGSIPPLATTDESGVARFEDLPAESPYLVRVQKIDYDVTFAPNVVVPEGQETEVTVSLAPHKGVRLYVGLDGARISEIDTASFLTVQTLSPPDWTQAAIRHVRVHPSRDLVYAIAGEEGCILHLQVETCVERFETSGIVEALSTDGTSLHVLTGPGIVVEAGGSEGSNVVVTSSDEPGQLVTMDALTGAQLSSEEVFLPSVMPQLVWRPGDEHLYVVKPFPMRSLWAVDAPPHQVLSDIPTGVYPTEGFVSADGNYRYTWSIDGFENLQSTLGDNLKVVSTNRLAVVSLSAFSISPTGQELYILDTQLGTLSILDPTGEQPPVLVAVGKHPVALVVSSDGRWAYVANRDSRTISVVYLPATSVVQTIPVEGEPFSLTIR